jgi:hypothetical protein
MNNVGDTKHAENALLFWTGTFWTEIISYDWQPIESVPRPVSCRDREKDSPLLLVETSDGRIQYGQAVIVDGKVSDWFLQRVFVLNRSFPLRELTPISEATVNKEQIHVVRWRYLPSADLVASLMDANPAI